MKLNLSLLHGGNDDDKYLSDIRTDFFFLANAVFEMES